MKQLDELDLKRQQDAEFTGDTYTSRFSGEYFLFLDTETKTPIDKATLRCC
jgi:type I restriction enzyme M protein